MLSKQCTADGPIGHPNCPIPFTCGCMCHTGEPGADQPPLFDTAPVLPIRPYGVKGAGWSGTDTSRDGERARGARQVQVLSYVRLKGLRGTTAAEAEAGLHLDHGKVSGPLSVLHRKAGMLARLKEKRGGMRVYVTTDNIGGRNHD